MLEMLLEMLHEHELLEMLHEHELLEMLHEHDFSHAREALGGMRAVPDKSGLDPMNRPTIACRTFYAGRLYAAKRGRTLCKTASKAPSEFCQKRLV